jgi:hypothetical protein
LTRFGHQHKRTSDAFSERATAIRETRSKMTAWCSRAKALEAAVGNETDLPSLLEPPTAATRLSERVAEPGLCR